MSNASFSRNGHNVRQSRPVRARLEVELLEDRALLSVNLVEAEPNNTMGQANVIPHLLDTQLHISGKVAVPADMDLFAIHFDQGDVFGATLTGQNGLNPALRMLNSAGELMMASDDSMRVGAYSLPANSPLRQGQPSDIDSELYYVISTGGTYYLEASSSQHASLGKYALDVMVKRPALKAQPVGTKQILFLDFDGARVNFNGYSGHDVGGQRTLSPMSAFLSDWGLTAANENAVIDAVVTKVTQKLSTYVCTNGLNGNFASTNIPGQFAIEIRNSRDHQDEFGINPLMSRIVIGGTQSEAGFSQSLAGQAQNTDVGNLKTDDEAVDTMDFITAGLTLFPQPQGMIIDFVATGIATFVAHEAGHLFGCFHTDPLPADLLAGTPNLMNHDIAVSLIASFGPDVLFGTADDGDIQLGVGMYWADEPFSGHDDALNTVAFGLSTGKASTLQAAALGGTSVVNTLQSTQIKLLLSEALARWRAIGVDTSGVANLQIRITDLPGTTLGQAQGNTITLDSNAAGWGWFVDKTPKSDSEFRTRGNQGEQDRMDLLTVLEHEVGHLLGFDHQQSGLMADTIFAGVRRSPTTAMSLPSHSSVDLLSIFTELRSLHGRKQW